MHFSFPPQMKIDRKKFFAGFRHSIDSTIEQEQVDGLEFLLAKMQDDPFWIYVPQIAYALATVFHETAGSFQPVEEGYYLGKGAKAFQKKLRYYPYFGRGYVQLTWKKNYEHAGKVLGLDLVNRPQLALEPETAYKVLTYGMHQGWFTGKKLSDYISDTGKDYTNARKIINGLDKAGLIAGYARAFEDILRTSKSTAPAVDPSKEQAGKSVTLLDDDPPTRAADPQTPSQPDPPVVEVQQVASAPTESALDRTWNKWSARWAAIPAGIMSGLLTFGAWLKDSPANLVIVGIVTTGAIVGSYFITRMIVNAVRDARTDKLKNQREQRDHELQMALVQAGASKDLHTVKLTPPPVEVPNSDPAPEGANA